MLTYSFYIFPPAVTFLIFCYAIYHFYTRPSPMIVSFSTWFSLARGCNSYFANHKKREEKKHIKKEPPAT